MNTRSRLTILLLSSLFLTFLIACDADTKTVDSCGDGFVDPGEECDLDVGENSCASLGHYNATGQLHCTPGCQFDLAECGGKCGDNHVDVADGEQCDLETLSGQNCQSLGYTGGTLRCAQDCTYDVSGCAGKCGNGVIDSEDGELCDGNALAGETCQTLGYHGGELVCDADCGGFNLDNCVAVGRCGDGVIQATYAEVCDGTNLDGRTCVGEGFHGGALACAADCGSLVLTDCEAAGRCGDGVIQEAHGEVCDGLNLNDLTCEARGWYGGSLACGLDCLAFEEGGCAERCGDGVIQGAHGESCDGANLGGQSCVTRGFGSGTLACDGACAFDDAACSMNYESPTIGTLIHVPAGTFQRDFDPSLLSVVSAFRMSRHEITRAQFLAVMGTDPSDTQYSSGLSDPVQMVSWYDAIVFCNKLSALEGLTPVYHISGVDLITLTYDQIPTANNPIWNAVTANWSANGYRLPTEMESMWAAMGADLANPGAVNTTGHTKTFAGSTGTNQIGNYAVFGYGTTEVGRTTTMRSNPAGSKLPNELGIYDLSGNVFELIWDWYGSWPAGTQQNYRGPATGTHRVRKGGSWGSTSPYCTVPDRVVMEPYLRDDQLGFHVVRN